MPLGRTIRFVGAGRVRHEILLPLTRAGRRHTVAPQYGLTRLRPSCSHFGLLPFRSPRALSSSATSSGTEGGTPQWRRAHLSRISRATIWISCRVTRFGICAWGHRLYSFKPVGREKDFVTTRARCASFPSDGARFFQKAGSAVHLFLREANL